VALFDTGALYTYVRESLLAGSPRQAVMPVRVTLGGRTLQIRELCLVDGKIDGLDFFGDAVPVAELGEVDGQALDAIIGLLNMERREIKLDPKSGTLDLEGLRRREFTEF